MKNLENILALGKQFSHTDVEISTKTTFEEMGMDSYDLVDFLVQVEEDYSIFIPDDQMLQLGSIQDVLNAIDQSNQEEN